MLDLRWVFQFEWLIVLPDYWPILLLRWLEAIL